MATAPSSPSPSLLGHLRMELARHPPFGQMEPDDVAFFLAQAEQRYYAPDELVQQPADGVVTHLFYIRQGAVTGHRGMADLSGGAFQYEAGELFPVGAAMAGRAVTATYRAVGDTFVLALPVAAMRALAARSPAFGDFLNGRVLKFLELSRRALQVAYSSQTLAEQSLESPLSMLVRREAVTCSPDTPLREALAQMHARRIGSMLVVDDGHRPVGILTRYDILGRVTLAGIDLRRPISDVMVQPVLSLTTEHSAQDAALLMSRHGIRHVPVTRDGRVVAVVSERDLFAMQRLSLKQVSTAIRAALDVPTLQLVAADIRRFARSLLGQGVQSRQITAIISHLNDVLTCRLLEVLAAREGVPLSRWCWLALGSEGRSEQTVATDQDNALLLPDDADEAERAAAQAFGRVVNHALDACGYPLCKGGVMAGETDGCQSLGRWRQRFAHWIEHGAPQDLLNASIYFDLRPLAGDVALAQALQAEVLEMARRTPRFLKQMADNALTRGVPLGWLGNVETDQRGRVDLKLQGTAVFVEAARIYALAHGRSERNTRDRLLAIGPVLGAPAGEYEAWVGGFEFLQMLRLRVQLERMDGPDAAGENEPNHLALDSLNDIDRRILKETFRVGRSLQQRLKLDYER